MVGPSGGGNDRGDVPGSEGGVGRMDRAEAGALIDAQFEEWKRDLEAMRLVTDRRLGGVGGALWQEVEQLRREFMGLRIKKAATWLAADDAWEAAGPAFHDTWADWVERAMIVRNSLDRGE